MISKKVRQQQNAVVSGYLKHSYFERRQDWKWVLLLVGFAYKFDSCIDPLLQFYPLLLLICSFGIAFWFGHIDKSFATWISTVTKQCDIVLCQCFSSTNSKMTSIFFKNWLVLFGGFPIFDFSLPAKKNNKARVTVKGLWGIFWQFWHFIQRTFWQFGIKEQKEEFHHRTKSSSVITIKNLWIESRFIQTQMHQPQVHSHSNMN